MGRRGQYSGRQRGRREDGRVPRSARGCWQMQPRNHASAPWQPPADRMVRAITAHGVLPLTVVGSQARMRGHGTGARAARRRREVAAGGKWSRRAWRGHPPGGHGGGQEGLGGHGAHDRGGHERLGRQHRAPDQGTAQRRQFQRQTRDDLATNTPQSSLRAPILACSDARRTNFSWPAAFGCCRLAILNGAPRNVTTKDMIFFLLLKPS